MNAFGYIVQHCIADDQYELYKKTIGEIKSNFSLPVFLANFSRAYDFTQKKNTNAIIQQAMQKLYKNYPNTEFAYWSMSDFLRASILKEIEFLPREKYISSVQKCYDVADTKERCSLLKSFAIINECEQFLSLALDAVRTNIPQILAAIACGNPYADKHFDESQWNNMVLKCIFMNISIAKIFRLRENANMKLMQMVMSYVNEREAAKRDFPPEVWIVIVPFLQEKDLKRVYPYVSHEFSSQRYWAIRALENRNDCKHILEKQLEIETDEKIKQLLLRCCS